MLLLKRNTLRPSVGEILITTAVFFNMIALSMLRPIHFNHQFCPWRVEIHNVFTDWFLPITWDA